MKLDYIDKTTKRPVADVPPQARVSAKAIRFNAAAISLMSLEVGNGVKFGQDSKTEETPDGTNEWYAELDNQKGFPVYREHSSMLVRARHACETIMETYSTEETCVFNVEVVKGKKGLYKLAPAWEAEEEQQVEE